jgi:hypothetical protein
LIGGARVDAGPKIWKPELDLFKKENHEILWPANSPQHLKSLYFKIRHVLMQLNTSFRYTDGFDPDREKIEFQELATNYTAAAAQFYYHDIKECKRELNIKNRKFKPSDLDVLRHNFCHVSYFADRETPVACHISATAIQDGRSQLRIARWFDHDELDHSKLHSRYEVYDGKSVPQHRLD